MLRATVATMGTGLMEYEFTGRVPQPRGNYDPVMAPYGNYPCQGEDQWVSIAVRTEAEWQGLVRAMGKPAWADEPIVILSKSRTTWISAKIPIPRSGGYGGEHDNFTHHQQRR